MLTGYDIGHFGDNCSSGMLYCFILSLITMYRKRLYLPIIEKNSQQKFLVRQKSFRKHGGW